jgi:hypothetical protein
MRLTTNKKTKDSNALKETFFVVRECRIFPSASGVDLVVAWGKKRADKTAGGKSQPCRRLAMKKPMFAQKPFFAPSHSPPSHRLSSSKQFFRALRTEKQMPGKKCVFFRLSDTCTTPKCFTFFKFYVSLGSALIVCSVLALGVCLRVYGPLWLCSGDI